MPARKKNGPGGAARHPDHGRTAHRSSGGRPTSSAARWTPPSTRTSSSAWSSSSTSPTPSPSAATQIRAELARRRRARVADRRSSSTTRTSTPREGVFWVPEGARWDNLAAQAKSAGIGELIDNAMDAIMKTNTSLTGVLPKIFNRDNVDQRRLGELVDLISDARFTGHDEQEGPRRPRRGLRVLPGDVRPRRRQARRRVLHPGQRRQGRWSRCLSRTRAGSTTRAAGRAACSSRRRSSSSPTGGRRDDIAVYGQESNERTWRLAKMNLAIHGINGDLSLPLGRHVLRRQAPRHQGRLHPGQPAVQHVRLGAQAPTTRGGATASPRRATRTSPGSSTSSTSSAPRGSAGVVLANGSMSSKQSGEGEIRAALVEADLVACMIALPPQLFRTTQIPACLWFFANDKGPQGAKHLTDRRGDILFIDARVDGHDARPHRAHPHRRRHRQDRRHLPRLARHRLRPRGRPEVRGHPRLLLLGDPRRGPQARPHPHPGSLRRCAETDDSDDEPIAEKIDRLTKELFAHFDESARLEQIVREQLERLDV